MDKNTVDNMLKNLILRNARTGIKSVEINNGTNIIDEFVFDSIQMIKLIAGIESEFDITIDSEYLLMDKFSKYGSIRDYILDKVMLK